MWTGIVKMDLPINSECRAVKVAASKVPWLCIEDPVERSTNLTVARRGDCLSLLVVLSQGTTSRVLSTLVQRTRSHGRTADSNS